MSYTQTFRDTIEVSGTVRVYCSPSETGYWTTENYYETVPVEINLYVETDEFDSSVRHTSNTVDTLTGSVVAMHSAQVAAIKQSTEKISESLVNGFYNLVASDVTMKKSENNSELQSKVALLMALSKDVSDTHARMDSDLQRLYSHFSGVFRGLDEDLAKRIRELDKPAFRLALEERENLIFKPMKTLAATTADALDAGNHTTEMITTARMRSNISRVLHIMADSLRKSLSYKKKMNDSLYSSSLDSATQEFMPVAYVVTNGENLNQYTDSYYVPDIAAKDQVVASVSQYVRAQAPNEGAPVQPYEMKLIDQEFTNLVETESRMVDVSDQRSNRVYMEILKMWNNNKATLKN